MELKTKEINPIPKDYIRVKYKSSHVRDMIQSAIDANRTDEKETNDQIIKRNITKWPFEPILIYKAKRGTKIPYELIDGVHRLKAAKKLKRKTIPVKVVQESNPGQYYVLQFLSQDKGLKLDIAQRNEAIKKMVRDFKISIRQIANNIGFSAASVSRIAAGKQALVKGGVKERKPARKEHEYIPDELFRPTIFFNRLKELIELGTTHREKLSKFLNASSKLDIIELIKNGITLLNNIREPSSLPKEP